MGYLEYNFRSKILGRHTTISIFIPSCAPLIFGEIHFRKGCWRKEFLSRMSSGMKQRWTR